MLPGVLKSENENPSQVQDLLAQEATEISDSEELPGVDQAYIEEWIWKAQSTLEQEQKITMTQKLLEELKAETLRISDVL
ncbi:hypothetical protein OWV82_009041 [Melia azedarach]|uniref:Uncharacterized protein n=1 Tax=Melia azedarach TaxID=155640 RepID=A0ACC1YD10_MELAZ|nr:hypothetical protein OWV82_009041 [Melia azedarach]